MNQTEQVLSTPLLVLVITIPCLFVLGIITWFVYRHMCKKLIGRLEYRREFTQDGVYEGDSVTLIETIYNPSKLPLIKLFAESYFFPDLELTSVTYKDKNEMQLFQSKFSFIMPYMQIRRKHTVICRKRGVYELESAEIFLPGTSRYVDSKARLYVYPKMLAAPATPAPIGILMGESVSRRMLIKDPFTFTGVRQYTFGDPFNQINFKATAKAYAQATQPLRVNALDYCSNRTFMIYINFQTDPKDPIPSAEFNLMMENSMSYTADIIRIMRENGYRLGLRTNSTQNNSNEGLNFPMRSGEIHSKEMLCGMSEVRIASSYSFSTLLQRDLESGISDTEIFIFSIYTDDDIESCIAALERNRNTVNMIVPPGKEDEDEK